MKFLSRTSKLLLAAELCVLSVALNPSSSFAASAQNMDGFARCLSEKKVIMYGSFLCPHCEDQKKVFGHSFRYVTYVECLDFNTRKTTATCAAAQIHYTPTWIFPSGQRLTGTQSAKQLSDASGCPLQ